MGDISAFLFPTDLTHLLEAFVDLMAEYPPFRRLLPHGEGNGPLEAIGRHAIQIEVLTTLPAVADDILGNNGPPYPRHSKQYRNLFKMKQEMQAERVAGFKEFVEEVRSGAFPTPQHVVKSPAGVIEAFLTKVDGKG